eukprot:gene6775-10939_t
MIEDLLISKSAPIDEKRSKIPMNIQSYIFSSIFTENYSAIQFKKLLSSVIYQIISEKLFKVYHFYFSSESNCFTGDIIVDVLMNINEENHYMYCIQTRKDAVSMVQLYLELGAIVNVVDSTKPFVDKNTEFYKFTDDMSSLEGFTKLIYSRFKEIQRIQAIVSSFPVIQMFYKSVKDKTSGVEIKDRSYRFYSYPKCFVGSELVAWIAMKYNVSKEGAVVIGEYMRRAGVFDHVCKDHSLKDAYLFYEMKPLCEFAKLSESYIINVRMHYNPRSKTPTSPRSSRSSISLVDMSPKKDMQNFQDFSVVLE